MPFHLCGARGQSHKADEILDALKKFREEERCEGQIIEAGMVFGKSHIYSAYEHARRAFEEESNSSESLANEVLLYASAERQISSAIKKMGIKDSTTEFCVFLIGDVDMDKLIHDLKLRKDDSVLKGDVRNLKAFGISKKELDTVPDHKVFDLVLERVAMVDLLK